jgi:hypothetical protein
MGPVHARLVGDVHPEAKDSRRIHGDLRGHLDGLGGIEVGDDDRPAVGGEQMA